MSNRQWEAIGMSRATWYRHGKPLEKPEAKITQRELAQALNVSIRTVQRDEAERGGSIQAATVSTRGSDTSHFEIATAGRAGPSLGSGSHIEAQIGTQFSALGSHCRIPGVC